MEIINKIKDEFMKSPILFSIIILSIIYLISKKTIENFSSSSDSAAIGNLAKLASYISSDGNSFTIPGNLKINGNLDVSNNLKAKHINTGGMWVYSDGNNIPTDTNGINGNQDTRKIEIGGDGSIISKGGSLSTKHINTGGVWVYSDANNLPKGINGINGSQANRRIQLGGDGTIISGIDDQKVVIKGNGHHKNQIKLYHGSTTKGGKIGSTNSSELLINGFTTNSDDNLSGEVKFKDQRVAKKGDWITRTNWPGGCGVVKHGYGCDGRNFDWQQIL